jgi:hypothetical protein
MKTKLALFLVVTTLRIFAQTNFDVLVCKNASYTNASIVRTKQAYVVVSYEDGYTRVAMTNLPDALQKQFGYDPDKAAAALAAEEKHRLDVNAEQKNMASLRGTNRVIQVLAMLDDQDLCQTSAGRVYLTGLPTSVREYVNRYNQLKVSVENLTEKIDKLKRIIIGYDESARADAITDSDLAKDDLEKANSNLSEMESGLIKNTSIVAYPTGIKYEFTIPIWQYVGVAPQN